jgi:hypothetical protein
MRECPCGSGKRREEQFDAQGIFLCYTYPDCEKAELSRYRPEILTGYTQADVDEPIEPDV